MTCSPIWDHGRNINQNTVFWEGVWWCLSWAGRDYSSGFLSGSRISALRIKTPPTMSGAPLSSTIFAMTKRARICWHPFPRAPSWASRALTTRLTSWFRWRRVRPASFAKHIHGPWDHSQNGLPFHPRCRYRPHPIPRIIWVLQADVCSSRLRQGHVAMGKRTWKPRCYGDWWSLLTLQGFLDHPHFTPPQARGTPKSYSNSYTGPQSWPWFSWDVSLVWFQELTPGRYYDVYCFSETYVPPAATGADTVAQFGMDSESILQTRTQLITLGPFFDDLGWSCVSGRPCNVTNLFLGDGVSKAFFAFDYCLFIGCFSSALGEVLV